MTETAATPQGVPVITADPFSPETLTDPRALHEHLREAGPVVYLDRYSIWGMARYEQVNAFLKDWETFSSAAGAGLSNFRKEKPWRPRACCSRPTRPPTPAPARSSARSWRPPRCGRCE